MAKIELNIVALGDFSAVNAQIKSLQVQVDALNKGVAGVGLGPQLTKDLQAAQTAFKNTMLSTGQFTMQTVKMASETEKFGTALVAGKLKLSDYFNIITGKAGQATASMNALAESQVKLNNSVVIQNKQGFLDVYTPTAFNEVAQAEDLVTMKAMLMQKAIDGGSTALVNFGKNTQWAGRQLTVGLTMPMVMFGAAAVKSFQQTNVELTRLQRLYGEGLTPPSQAQLNQISGQVLQLGTQIAQTMGIAQTETVKTAANFAAMGKQGQDLLNITTQAERLSKLGGVDSQQATDAIVALQNVYKVSTNDLANAVNFLSDVQKQTTMSLTDMTTAIPKVGPIMEQLGGTYKDTAVMLLAMREAGIPAAQSANALKSAMASIIAPTSAAVKEFESFGINLNSIKSAGGPVQMIQALQASLQSLSPLVREQLIEKLFGKFQFARISALIDNFGKAGSQTVNALKVAGATSSQLADLANQEMKQATSSVSAQWTRALEGFKATLYPIGQKFVEMGSIILGVANKIGKAFSSLPSPLKGFFGFLVIGAALAGPLIMLTGLLSNFAGYILKGVGLVTKLANGGMSLKELLTPEIVASQKAAELFSNQIVNDVDAVDLLNQAIERLTVSLSEMSSAMSLGTGDIATKTAAVAATSANLANVNGVGEGGVTGPEGIFYRVQKEDYKYVSTPTGQALGITKPAIKLKPPTGFYGTNIDGLNTRLANSGVTGQEIITSMTSYTKEINNAVTKFKTSTSDYLDTIIKMKDQAGQGIVSEEEANNLKAEINNALQAELIALDEAGVKITDQNSPLFSVSDRIIRERAAATGNADMLTTWEQANTQYSAYPDYANRSGKTNPISLSVPGRNEAQIAAYKAEGEGNVFFHQGNDFFLKARAKIIEQAKSTYQAAANAINTVLGTTIGKDKSIEAAGVKTGESFITPMQATIEAGMPGLATASAEAITAETSVFSEAAGVAGDAAGLTFMERMKNKLTSNGGMGIGLMLGGTMLGQTMSSSSNSAINTLGSGVTMGANAAGIAMMTGLATAAGPLAVIAASVAGVTVATKELIKYMDEVKAHNAAISSSFKANSDAISAYGGSMINATQATYNFNTGTKQTAQALSQTAQDVANIAKLKPTDSLKQIGDLLKGGTDAKGVIGTVEQYAAAQVANGMDPSKVSHMVTDLLTYAGQTQYLNAALKEVTKNTQDVSTATETWLNKLTTTNGFIPVTSSDYSMLNTQQKAYADSLLSTSNVISNSSTPISTVIAKLQAMNTSTQNTVSAVNALAAALSGVNVSASQAVSQMGTLGASVPQIMEVLRLNNLGVDTSAITNAKTNSGFAQALGEAVTKDVQTTAASEYDAALSSVQSAQAAIVNNNVQQSATAGLSTAQSNLLTNDKARIKALDAQLTLMKQQTQQLQAQQQYNLSQADLDNQIRMAQASGNFLQAALLQQQKAGNTNKYNQDTQQQSLQDQKDNLTAEVANLDQLVADFKTVASNSAQNKTLTDALSTAQTNLKNIAGKDTGKGLADQIKTALSAVDLTQFSTPGGKVLYVSIASAPTNTANGGGSGLPQEKIGRGARGATQYAPYGYAYDKKTNSMVAIDQYGNPATPEEIKQWATSGKASGGLLVGPGTGTSDSILARYANGGMLRVSAGEYITKASSVSRYGTAFMDSINQGTFNPKFATAGAPSIPAASGTIGGAVYNITVNAQTSANTDEIVKAVTDSIKRIDSMTSSNRRIKI